MNEWPWLRALAWLAFLGPFFFLTYNFANAAAGHRAQVPVVMFPWERSTISMTSPNTFSPPTRVTSRGTRR